LSINLALILTLLTLFTGVVVALDKLVWRTGSQRGGSISLLTLVEYSRSFFPVLLFVLVIRSFVFEPFRIPSGSMMPTLLQGDFIFVKKYSYGLRLPVTESKFIDTGSPERGDVIVSWSRDGCPTSARCGRSSTAGAPPSCSGGSSRFRSGTSS
jgi:signal peptidase I